LGTELSPSPTPDRRLPPYAPGQAIGLLGGSFNPPHAAHRAISLLALKRLGLDRLWWLVTPGNPLKDTHELLSLPERMKLARAVAAHPRIDVTDIEAEIGTSYTCATLLWLKSRCPGVKFVWIMGADNLGNFHQWQNWQTIASLVPIAVVDRGGIGLSALSSRAAQTLRQFRIPEQFARTLSHRHPPAWVLLHGVKSSLSSTEIRRKSERLSD